MEVEAAEEEVVEDWDQEAEVEVVAAEAVVEVD